MQVPTTSAVPGSATKFVIEEEKSPARILEGRKERFLQSRLREEEKQRKKKMEKEQERLAKKKAARLVIILYFIIYFRFDTKFI